MQPEILILRSPISRCRSGAANLREISCAIGIERALASAQKSSPGQVIMSVISPALPVGKPGLDQRVIDRAQIG